LAVFGESYCREALFVEGVVISAAQVAVEAKNKQGFELGLIRSADVGNIARQFAGVRITLPAQAANLPQLSVVRRNRHGLVKHTDHAEILLGCPVSPDDVIVQHCFDLPTLLLSRLGEILAAIEPLLFYRNRQKDDGCREFELA